MDSTRVSELLFGPQASIHSPTWVLQHPRVVPSVEPRDIDHASTSNIVDELGRLVQLGMLDGERPEDSRRVYYVRTNSPLWDIVTATLEAIDADAEW